MATIGSLVRDRPLFSVGQQTKVLEAARYMADKNVGALAVVDGTRLVGIFSERDVIKRVIAKQLDPQSVAVEEVMTRDLVVADVAESEDDCLRKMKAAGCRHLPVVSGDRLVGMISLRDLLQVGLIEREEKLEYLTSHMFNVSSDPEKRKKL